MKKNYLEYCAEGAQYTERMVQIDQQVSLRVLSFVPAKPTGNMPIVMATGLSTIIDSFQAFLREITRDFPVHYIESREKPSSILNGKVRFDIEALGLDIVTIIRILELNDSHYVLMGYSFGATSIADAYRHLESRPRHVLLLEPTPVFHYPKWSLPIIRWLGVPLFPILKPIAKWYLAKFHINIKEDHEMARISFKALDSADPRKLKNTILAIAGYTVWHRLSTIDCDTLIVVTSKDNLHIHKEVISMSTAIPNCRCIDLETNERTHSAEMATVIRDYISGTIAASGSD